jgi:hypothetical protein
MPIKPQDPVVALLAQGEALQSALRVVYLGDRPDDARLRCRSVAHDTRPDNLVEVLLVTAAARIAGDPPTILKLPRMKDDLTPTITTLCRAWLTWTQGDVPASVLADIRGVQRTETPDEVVDSMVIQFWAKAMVALFEGDLAEARRLWRRANDLASSFGLDSQPAIAWSYAATFFPEG